jgi:hypothetical protein
MLQLSIATNVFLENTRYLELENKGPKTIQNIVIFVKDVIYLVDPTDFSSKKINGFKLTEKLQLNPDETKLLSMISKNYDDYLLFNNLTLLALNTYRVTLVITAFDMLSITKEFDIEVGFTGINLSEV